MNSILSKKFKTPFLVLIDTNGKIHKPENALESMVCVAYLVLTKKLSYYFREKTKK